MKLFENKKLWLWWSWLTLMVTPTALLFTEAIPVWCALFGLLLVGGLLAGWITATKRLGLNILTLLWLCIFNAWEIVLLGLYGRDVIAVDMFLNFVTTNPGEVGELLGNLWVSVGLVIVLYLPPLVAAVVMLIKKSGVLSWHLRRRALAIGGAAAVIGLVGVVIAACTTDYCPKRDLYPANVSYNLWRAFREAARVSHRDEKVRSFTFDIAVEPSHPESLAETYIIVIGETSRADRWELNGYRRATNPRLAQREGIISFARALSESNTTHKSVPMLLTHLTAENFGDSIDRVHGILHAFSRAGYSTAFVSNQQRNGSYIDMLGLEADTTIFLKDKAEAANESDMALVANAKALLASMPGHKRLLVLHAYGSHFSYCDRYPAPGTFLPDTYPAADRRHRDQLNNAYDNTIVFTDMMLDSLISLVKEDNAALIYVSDHGEDIFDDERNLFLHASPSPSFYQLHVPLIVWMSETYRFRYPEIAGRLNRNSSARISSSAALFPIAANLAGLQIGQAPFYASPASEKFKEYPRLYLTDHNETVPLLRSGFLPLDTAPLEALDGRK